MTNRYLDWFRQAQADLRHARNSLSDGDYDWSCFDLCVYTRSEFEQLPTRSPGWHRAITSGIEI